VLYLGVTYEGKEHDKTILEADEVSFSQKIDGYVDLAYLKVKIKNMTAILPHKKPKGKELTELQKEENKDKSKIRVGVEHSISGIKRVGVLKNKLRVKHYYQHDQLMLLGCGIHNYRVKKRTKSIKN
jgi:DDE superfamily endonuclease